MARMGFRVRAPFAAFRWMQAGVYRASSPVIPPSAAWGLLLNLAGVETRGDGGGVTTLVRDDAPALRVAIGRSVRLDSEGIATPPESIEVSTIYQQLHGYPVGNSAKEFKERAKGSKYNIAPARREVLVDLDLVVAVESDDGALLQRMADGLDGKLDVPRYGLLFAGDNNLLIDRIDRLTEMPEIWWYERIVPEDGPRVGSCRLTIGIDRSDSSRTTSALFAPVTAPTSEPPPKAWTWTPRPLP